MGNRIKTFQKQELQYHSTVADGNYSCSDVYTCKNLPLSFIAKLKLNCQDEPLYQSLCEQFGEPNRYLVTLYNYNKTKECQCRHFLSESLVSYWEYYNYFLNNLLERRVGNKTQFSDEEFWHIVMVCCGGYKALKDNSIYYDFSPDKLALTPQGKLKLFWAHTSTRNIHLNYIHFFQSRCLDFLPGYYSPEQLQEIANHQRNLKLNFQKCNVFSFGMMLLYCLTLMDPIKYFYMQYKIDFAAVQKTIKKKLVGNYSNNIVQLVEGCLVVEPKNRMNFSEIQNLSKDNFIVDSSLNLIGGTTTTASKAESEVIIDKRSKTSRISLKKYRKQ